MSKPFWIDGCCHGEDAFIGSVSCAKTGEMLDVYVWKRCEVRYDVCVRYGSEADQYESAGEVIQYLLCPNTRESVRELILKSGTFSYKKN